MEATIAPQPNTQWESLPEKLWSIEILSFFDGQGLGDIIVLRNVNSTFYRLISLVDVYLFLIEHCSFIYPQIPPKLVNSSFLLRAVGRSRYFIYTIPRPSITYEIASTAIQKTPTSLECIPEEIMDYKLSNTALQLWEYALQYVPVSFRSRSLYITAVSNHGMSIEHVPEEHVDDYLCELAVRKDKWAFTKVPDKWRSYSLCLSVVKLEGVLLSCVPEQHRDYTMCIEAVSNYPPALSYVPIHLRTYELCWMTMNSLSGERGLSLEEEECDVPLGDVPKAHLTYDMYFLCVSKSGCLWLVPEEYRDYAMCLKAVQIHDAAIRSVPDEHKDINLCLEATKASANRAVLYRTPRNLCYPQIPMLILCKTAIQPITVRLIKMDTCVTSAAYIRQVCYSASSLTMKRKSFILNINRKDSG